MPEPKRPLKVFLCHASTDKPKVRELYRYLKKRGIQPWFDEEDLVGGQDWQVEIPKALATSDAIIICLTKNSVDKEGYIQKEIKFALDKALEMPEGRIFLIPVKFEDCEVPFTLSRYQWVDLTVESGYAKMMKALKFRASQLERSIVKISGKVVEEGNLVLERKKLEVATHITQEQKEIREKQSREVKEKNKLEDVKKEDKPVVKRPKASGQIAYWFGGIIVLILGIIFLSSLNNLPSTPQPTPEDTQTQAIANSTQDTTEPSTTVAIKSTLPPSVTLAPTPLPTEIMDSKDVSMILVPEGEFTMGSENGNTDEKPAHNVYLESYYIDKYEVTNSLYSVCVNSGICLPPENFRSFGGLDYYYDKSKVDYPVIYVDWNSAVTYCEWRGARLPTEAEWEKAARGSDSRIYPWGSSIPDSRNGCNYANYTYHSWGGNCSLDGSAVGQTALGKSPYGVYDMAGNVAEWVADWYSPKYYSESSYKNPLGPTTGTQKIVRGGSWYDNASSIRIFLRSQRLPDDVNPLVGFRCASNP